MSKDKELTPIEANQLALKQESPRWYFSNPLFTVLADEETGALELFPLEKSVAEKNWVIGFLDPSQPDGAAVLNALKLWQERYLHLPLQFLAVFVSEQPWMKSPPRRDPFVRRDRLAFPVVVDDNGDVVSVFGVESVPCVQLRTPSGVLSTAIGPHLPSFEHRLQEFLRQVDPGLALFDPLRTHEFVTFEAVRLPASASWKWTGNWVHQSGGHELVGTSGSVTIPTTGTHLAIVAESDRGERIVGEAEIDGSPAFDVFLDEPRMEITDARVYRILKNLSDRQHSITLKFNIFKGQKLNLFSVLATRPTAPDSSAAAGA